MNTKQWFRKLVPLTVTLAALGVAAPAMATPAVAADHDLAKAAVDQATARTNADLAARSTAIAEHLEHPGKRIVIPRRLEPVREPWLIALVEEREPS